MAFPQTRHPANEDTGRGPSPTLWAKCPDNYRDWNVAISLEDDFTTAGGLVASNVGGWGGYKTYEDTGGSISLLEGTLGLLPTHIW